MLAGQQTCVLTVSAQPCRLHSSVKTTLTLSLLLQSIDYTHEVLSLLGRCSTTELHSLLFNHLSGSKLSAWP